MKQERNLVKGVVAGLVAGLAATWIKGKFQTEISQVQQAVDPPKPEPKKKQEGPEESTTVKTARAISKNLLHHELTEPEKQIAGPAVDMGFGTLMGGFYGAVAEAAPAVTAGGGLMYGLALWALGDELGLPAVGLAKWPKEYPVSTHAYALSGHAVYGLALELSRRIVRRALD